MEETLYEKICRYHYLYSTGNKKFLERLLKYHDDYVSKIVKRDDIVSLKQVINYMAVCDYEDEIYFEV